jgi:Ca2+-binding EF-hand superfamily protein
VTPTDHGSAAVPAAAPTKPRSGRFLTPTERLPKGLPAWFLAKDVHGNGQITMAEFASEWTSETAAEFNRYDLNHDGIITAAEVLKVEARQAERPPR